MSTDTESKVKEPEADKVTGNKAIQKGMLRLKEILAAKLECNSIVDYTKTLV